MAQRDDFLGKVLVGEFLVDRLRGCRAATAIAQRRAGLFDCWTVSSPLARAHFFKVQLACIVHGHCCWSHLVLKLFYKPYVTRRGETGKRQRVEPSRSRLPSGTIASTQPAENGIAYNDIAHISPFRQKGPTETPAANT